MRGRRPKEAWDETGTALRAELAYGVVGGALVCLYFTFTEWPEDPVATVAIPIGAAVGAAILVPLAQFIWRVLWQPWNDIKAKVADLDSENHMGESERLVVVLRNYLRQGFELAPYRQYNSKTYDTSEEDDLEDWTHAIVTCLTEYGTKEQCEKFIGANKLCPPKYAVHREWTLARIAVLEGIIEELDPTPAEAED